MADEALKQVPPEMPPAHPPLKETDEVEIKIITHQGKSDFKKLIAALQEKGLFLPPAWSKELHSVYFDTEQQDLNKNGRALRIRYEFDKHAKRQRLPDLSTKSLGESFGHGVKRTELETTMPKIKLDLNALYKEYENDEEAIAYLDEMTDLIGRDPHSLREIFSIQCTRMNFNTALTIATAPDGTKTATPCSAANDNDPGTKRLIFEFSLDHSRFLLHRFKDTETTFLGEDFEIEAELKTKECAYALNPRASSPGVTPDEVVLGQNYIVGIIAETLDANNLDWSGRSKQERGFSLREAFEKTNGPLPLASKPSCAGKSIPVIALNHSAQKRNTPG